MQKGNYSYSHPASGDCRRHELLWPSFLSGFQHKDTETPQRFTERILLTDRLLQPSANGPVQKDSNNFLSPGIRGGEGRVRSVISPAYPELKRIALAAAAKFYRRLRLPPEPARWQNLKAPIPFHSSAPRQDAPARHSTRRTQTERSLHPE